MASARLFTVRRHEPVLVAPASPTPSEYKLLSDIDDQQGLRYSAGVISLYDNAPWMSGQDPAKVLRSALAKALVFYYPLAGRLREAPGGKLAVECTGEGAVFIEADADVRLEQFGAPPQPPFPCLEELIYVGEDASLEGYINTPLLFLQMTRLACGGFIIGFRIKHVVADGTGVGQIMKALSEIARGADAPTVPPVWEPELLMARDPPRVTHAHTTYDQLPAEDVAGDVTSRAFFFGPREVAALKRRLPPRLRGSSRFEVVTSCLWRSRTIALNVGDQVRLRIAQNARSKCSPPLPAGYYGNALAYPVAVAAAAAAELGRRPLAYAVELVREAKASVTEGYLQSAADFLVLRGRPRYTAERTFMVSDASRLGLNEFDIGWGAPVYSGTVVVGGRSWVHTYYIGFKNGKGEDGILVTVNMPAPAMERFVAEIDRMINEPPPAAIGVGEEEEVPPTRSDKIRALL